MRWWQSTTLDTLVVSMSLPRAFDFTVFVLQKEHAFQYTIDNVFISLAILRREFQILPHGDGDRGNLFSSKKFQRRRLSRAHFTIAHTHTRATRRKAFLLKWIASTRRATCGKFLGWFFFREVGKIFRENVIASCRMRNNNRNKNIWNASLNSWNEQSESKPKTDERDVTRNERNVKM